MTPIVEECFEETVLSRVALDTGQVHFVVAADDPQLAAHVFRKLAHLGVNVDLIVQSDPAADENRIAFTVAQEHRPEVFAALSSLVLQHGGSVTDSRVAKLSLWGTGLMSHGEIASSLFTALADARINLSMITTSEQVITVVVDFASAEVAFDAAGAAFQFSDEASIPL